MHKHDDHYSFIEEANTTIRWMTTQRETIENCELEMFKVIQDYPKGPIKSKFGKLSDNGNQTQTKI